MTAPASASEAGEPNRLRGVLRRMGGPTRRALLIITIAIAAAVVTGLVHELSRFRLRDVEAALGALAPRQIAVAVLLTGLAFVVLPGYDAVALAYAGRRLPVRRLALASFVAYATSQALGFAILTGGAVRYRLWSRWGLSLPEIATAASFGAFTYTLGATACCGVVLSTAPGPVASLLHLPPLAVRAIGALLLLAIAAYLGLAARGGHLRIRGHEVPVPRLPLALAQLGVAAIDWTVAASVLFVLLPRGHGIAFPVFLGIFVVAQSAGLVSHVPGGIGVLEGAILLLLEDRASAPALLASLLVWRGVFYLLPFAVALAVMGVAELELHRHRLGRHGQQLARLLADVLPQALAIATALVGTVVLVGTVLPRDLAPAAARVPLAVLEASHFLSSLVAVALLVVARGLWRRLGGAFVLALTGLVAAAALAFARGLPRDAVVALAVAAALLPARPRFHRRARWLDDAQHGLVFLAVASTVAAAIAIGLVVHRHVGYHPELWSHVALNAHSARFLRAAAGALGVVAVFGIALLLRPQPVRPHPPTPDELVRAADVVRRSGRAGAWIALTGDKALLFPPPRAAGPDGFLAYGVSGRSWVALGDPVAVGSDAEELLWTFRELAAGHGGWPVFYEVGPTLLPSYLELGLALLKIGENASVDLQRFTLEGGARKSLRRTAREVEEGGGGFEVVDAAGVPALLDELRAVSDAWLAAHATREKGFSVGRFDPAVLERGPVAVVRASGRVVAFANLLVAPPELSVDLMRHLPDAPGGVMDFLFARAMLWGREQGLERFDLGMAPLAGLPGGPAAPLWSRVGATVFRHGEHFYNFQGVRQYKQKFHPAWEPRFLAAPGGLALPRIAADLAVLVAGGVRGVFGR